MDFENKLSEKEQPPNYIQIELKGSKLNPNALGSKVVLKFKDGSIQYQEQQLSRGYMSSNDPILYFGLGDEKKLDVYEDFPVLYKKLYFPYYNKKVMTYIMVNKTEFKYPTERYLNVVKRGYKDCKLDTKYLKIALQPVK